MGLLGALLMWFFTRNKVKGDLSLEGEGALRGENDSLRAKLLGLEGDVNTRNTEIGGLKTKLAAAAAVGAAGVAVAASKGDGDDDDASYALEWRNRYLAARVKYLEGRVAETPAKKKAKKKPAKKKVVAKKKPAVKKAAVKKPAKKKVVKAKAKPAAKPKAKTVAKKKPKAATAKTKTAKAKKATPEKGTLNAYHADVLRYHKTANKYVVKGIVDHLGIALRSRDGSLVACSDQKEKDTIIKGWCTKKLGLDAKAASAAVEKTCVEMKGDRFKDRVTFYYLVAKNTRKLAKIK
jgi:hypothetical protein